MKRQTCETLNASIVAVMPKSTSRATHPDAFRVDAGVVTSGCMSADYKGPRDRR
jgi:hypothetical protein